VLVEVSKIQSVTVVTLRAAVLIKANCARIRKTMAAAVDFKSPTIVDLGFVKYFDTAGLSLILQWLAQGRRMGGQVVICSDSPEFRSLTELVRISSFTTLFVSLGEALNSLCQSTSSAHVSEQPARVQRVSATAVG
jgi:anti-anti-sigma factor